MAKFLIASNESQAESLFPINEINKLKADNQYFCLVRTTKGFIAFEHQCPHQGHSLSLGRINSQHQIICPLHGYGFDLKFGDEESFRCRELIRYRVFWEEGELYVDF